MLARHSEALDDGGVDHGVQQFLCGVGRIHAAIDITSVGIIVEKTDSKKKNEPEGPPRKKKGGKSVPYFL